MQYCILYSIPKFLIIIIIHSLAKFIMIILELYPCGGKYSNIQAVWHILLATPCILDPTCNKYSDLIVVSILHEISYINLVSPIKSLVSSSSIKKSG